MNRLLGLTWAVLAGSLGCSSDGVGRPAAPSAVQPRQATVVRIAELEIDPAQLDSYLAIVKKEMEASIRVEPGVLAIYAVADKDDPTKLTFFEMYADEAAYLSHRETPHFKEYVEGTKDMIKSRKLKETVPVQLSAKR
jgi:quinol monooxygenase YgiN